MGGAYVGLQFLEAAHRSHSLQTGQGYPFAISGGRQEIADIAASAPFLDFCERWKLPRHRRDCGYRSGYLPVISEISEAAQRSPTPQISQMGDLCFSAISGGRPKKRNRHRNWNWGTMRVQHASPDQLPSLFLMGIAFVSCIIRDIWRKQWSAWTRY